ncbi:MAG: sce7725 family protein [Syntrophales bacterium]|jgi:hypothetical protein
MYYPYFRGKQYELIAIRENACRMVENIIPIIEPVKRSLSGLKKAIEAMIEHNVRFILIANPRCGDLCDDPSPAIDQEIKPILDNYANWSLGCIIDERSTFDEIKKNVTLHNDVSIIHNGYPQGSALVDQLKKYRGISAHVFIEDTCSRLYRRHFVSKQRILIRNGFIQRTNRNHPEVEHFSDLHITYPDEGMNGFGDFLIVGSEYSEAGGPAYAVAIHLTFIDHSEDDDMFIKHYVSDRSATPTDPAGKFAEALSKLVVDVNKRKSPMFHSDAIKEYLRLHEIGHYPGLGFVKKLSMQHHIELVANFLE